MKTYLHIGYPKNFSTSLQRSYFSKNPDLYHLGIGVGSNIGYMDPLLSAIFEVYLKTSKSFKYLEVRNKLKAHIDEHKNKAQKLGKKAIGVSSEHFSFGFTYDSVDFSTKIKRFKDLFGTNIKVIMIVREQMAILKSLYRESVRVGLPYTFQEYLYSMYKYQDRNYFYDLRYDLVFTELVKEFGRENILVEVFDEHKLISGGLKPGIKSGSAITESISDFLDVTQLEEPLQHFNEKLDPKLLVAKYQLNQTEKHDLGNDLYKSAESHRQSEYFTHELELFELEEVAFKDVLTKRKLLQQANNNAKNITDKEVKKLFEVDFKLYNKINDFFQAGNCAFYQSSGINFSKEQ